MIAQETTEEPPSATATATASPAPTDIPDIFTDTFETGDLSPWEIGRGWSRILLPDGNHAMQGVADESRLLLNAIYDAVQLEADVQLLESTLRVHLRQSVAGRYLITLEQSGQVTLSRSGEQLAEAKTQPGQPQTWRHMSVSVVGNTIEVRLDGDPVLTATDTMPLPAGQIGFSAIFPGQQVNNHTVLVDNVMVQRVVDAPPTATVTASPTPDTQITPTATTTPDLDALRLVPVCSPAPGEIYRWRIRNLSQNTVIFDWAIDGSPVSGQETIAARSDFLLETSVSAGSVLRLLLSDQEVARANGSSLSCETATPPPTATSFATATPMATATTLPDYQPLTACWVGHQNGTGATEWRINNPNPVPLSASPEVKLFYDWAVYSQLNATGDIVQSAQAWENPDPNPLNTAYAQSLALEWYLVVDGRPTEIAGGLIVSADTSGRCADSPLPTDTPQPTTTRTPVPTDTPQPTTTSTIVPTDTPQPTTTSTTVPTDTPQPTTTSTTVPTDTPQPTATRTIVPTDTPQPTTTRTIVPTDTPQPTTTRTIVPTTTLTATPTREPLSIVKPLPTSDANIEAWPATVTPQPTATPPLNNMSVPNVPPDPRPACDVTIAAGDTAGLISAIEAANAVPYEDSVICLTNSTYLVTDAYNNGSNGFPGIFSNISIVGNGATIERRSDLPTVAPDVRFFYVNNNCGGQFAVYDTTFLNGAVAGSGGAIYALTRTLLDNVTFDGNYAGNLGGAVHLVATNADYSRITGSTFINNVAAARGGGLSYVAPLTSPRTMRVESTLFEYNSNRPDWTVNSSGYGGGLFLWGGHPDGDLTLHDVTIQHNGRRDSKTDTDYTAAGGGIFLDGVRGMQLINSTLSNNYAEGAFDGENRVKSGFGGAIYSVDKPTDILLRNVIIDSNYAQFGGGITAGNSYGSNHNSTITMVLEDSNVINNYASAGNNSFVGPFGAMGAGLYLTDMNNTVIRNVSFSGNYTDTTSSNAQYGTDLAMGTGTGLLENSCFDQNQPRFSLLLSNGSTTQNNWWGSMGGAYVEDSGGNILRLSTGAGILLNYTASSYPATWRTTAPATCGFVSPSARPAWNPPAPTNSCPPPEILITDTQPVYTENDPAVDLIDTVDINYASNSELSSVSVVLTNLQDGAAEQLAVNTGTTGITTTYTVNANDSELLLTGPASEADFETVLESLTYENTLEHPNETMRYLDVTIQDENTASATDSLTVGVQAVNDLPVLDLDVDNSGGLSPNVAMTYTDNGGQPQTLLVAGDVAIDDLDMPDNPAPGTITDTIRRVEVMLDTRPDGATEILSVDATTATNNNITATYDAGLLLLTGQQPPAAYEAVLATLAYRNETGPVTAGQRVATVAVFDSEMSNSPGSYTNHTATITIDVQVANVAPTLDLDTANVSGASPDYADSHNLLDGSVAVTGDVTITDTDDLEIAGATIVMSSVPDGAAEQLTIDTLDTFITVTTLSSASLELSGTASFADYERVLETLTYTNTSATPDTNSSRVIDIRVNDGQADSAVRTSTLNLSLDGESLPPDYTCFDWRRSGNNGWADVSSADGSVVFTADVGMYGVVDNGAATAPVQSAYGLTNAGPYQMYVGTNLPDDGASTVPYVVAQGAAMPAAGEVFTDDIPRASDGSYTVTQPYIQLQWDADDSATVGDPGTGLVFHHACYHAIGAPDLTITALDTSNALIDPATLDVTGTFDVTIENNGTRDVPDAFTLTVFEDRDQNQDFDDTVDGVIGTQTIDSLAVGASQTLTVDATGQVEIPKLLVSAFVDSADTISETDEANNQWHETLTCEAATTGTFDPQLEWRWPAAGESYSSAGVITSPIVMDLTGDDISEIIFITFASRDFAQGTLRALDGQTGTLLFSVAPGELDSRVTPAVGDLDLDGVPEIVVINGIKSELRVYNADGTIKWTIPHAGQGWNPLLANMVSPSNSQDPDYPEIVTGDIIYSYQGNNTWTNWDSPRSYTSDSGNISLAADFDLDGQMEFSTGSTVFDYDPVIGVWSEAWTALSANEGLGAVADLDPSDAAPEIAYVVNNELYVLSPSRQQIVWGPIAIPGSTKGGGAPTIADIDGDGLPEIGVAGSSRYSVFDIDSATGLSVKWVMVTDDTTSGRTGSTVFDFDGDGVVEIVYRDEEKLRIYRDNGTGGQVVWEQWLSSTTGFEYPTIADIDNDGNAEIIVPADTTNPDWRDYDDDQGIHVFADNNDIWVPTRAVWNQHAYHITNVNDDGTIPETQVNNWDIYNNFRLNTYTEGCVGAQPDLIAAAVNSVPNGTTTTITARVANAGNIFVPAGVPVSFYDGDPLNGGVLLGSTTTPSRLDPRTAQDVTFDIPGTVTADPLWVVADDTGNKDVTDEIDGIHTEADESNNVYGSNIRVLNPVNQAPTVTLDPAPALLEPASFPEALSLTGTVTDPDNQPLNLPRTAWTLEAGTADGVTFDSTTASTADVTFSRSGVYTFRLTATDGHLSDFDEVTVTVEGPVEPELPVPDPNDPRPDNNLDRPGCLVSPLDNSTLSIPTPIQVEDGTTLTNAAIFYWPSTRPSDWQLLTDVGNIQASGGPLTVATFDTSLLANDIYGIQLVGTNASGDEINCTVAVSVEGAYKPGRVTLSVTDFTVSVSGIPISIGRVYDSLERTIESDFGYGWNLSMATGRVEITRANDVTLTLPDGQRRTFYFTPMPPSPFLGTFLAPRYTPEVGEYGTLTANGCGLLVYSSNTHFCFPGGAYNDTVSTVMYTDTRGRTFTYDVATGNLVKVEDTSGNGLEIASDGIFVLDVNGNRLSVSNPGAEVRDVLFSRDSNGRITSITTPPDGSGNVKTYSYTYDANGDLVTVSLPDVDNDGLPEDLSYTYDTAAGREHLLTSATDFAGNAVSTATYYDDGRLQTETDILGTVTSYTYAEHDGTAYDTDPGVTMPDRSTEVAITPSGQTAAIETTQTIQDERGNMTEKSSAYADNTPTRRMTFTYANENMTETRSYAADGTTVVTLNEYAYDGDGNRTRVTTNGTMVMEMRYDDLGGPARMRDASGHVQEIDYNNRGLPTVAGDAIDPQMRQFVWNGKGQATEITDERGLVTQNSYSIHGDLTTQSEVLPDNSQNTATAEYDEFGRMETVSYTASQIRSETDYDALGQVIREATYDTSGTTDELLRETLYSYDVNGNRTLVSVWNGTSHDDTVYTYNSANQLIAVQYPDGSTQTYTYNFRGNKLTETDRQGITTCYEYYDSGQTKRVRQRCGEVDANSNSLERVTAYVYDALGRQTTVTTAQGTADELVTANIYDSQGRVEEIIETATVSGEVVRTCYEYDTAGRLLSETRQCGTMEAQTTAYLYDARGRQIATIHPDGNVQSKTYDIANNVTQTTDPNGNHTAYTYNARGNVTSITHGAFSSVAATTTFNYDVQGRRTDIVDALGRSTLFGYDGLGQLVSKTWPDGTEETYAYDVKGNQIRKTLPDATPTNDADNPTHTFSYDNMNRIDTAVYDYGGQSETVSYTYNATSTRLQSVSYPAGTTTYAYDAVGQMQSITQPSGSVSYTYDRQGRRASMTTPGGTTLYSYDARNRLTSIGDGTDTIQMTYNLDSTLHQIQRPNGLNTTYDYDVRNRVTQITHGTGTSLLAQYTYELDAAGLRTRETDQDGNFIAWDYDARNRLVSETHSTGLARSTTDYSYDAVNNRTAKQTGSQVTAYSYNNLDQLTEVDYGNYQTDTYTYDARGRLDQKTDKDGLVTTYSYNPRDQLTQVNQGGAVSQYVYDHSGKRIQSTSGGVTTDYVWDAGSRYGDVVYEGKSNGTSLAYLLAGNMVLAQTRETGNQEYLLGDAHNSTRLLVTADSAMTELARYEYYAYGDLVDGSSNNGTRYLFNGQQYDRATKTYSLRARHYDPSTGRFLTRDPYQGNYMHEFNRYVYAMGNPVMFSDPSGLNSLSETTVTNVKITGTTGIAQTSRHVADDLMIGMLAGMAGYLTASVLIPYYYDGKSIHEIRGELQLYGFLKALLLGMLAATVDSKDLFSHLFFANSLDASLENIWEYSARFFAKEFEGRHVAFIKSVGYQKMEWLIDIVIGAGEAFVAAIAGNLIDRLPTTGRVGKAIKGFAIAFESTLFAGVVGRIADDIDDRVHPPDCLDNRWGLCQYL